VREFRDAHAGVVRRDAEPGLAVVASAVVVVVGALRDDGHADLVVVLDLTRAALDLALAAGRPLHRAVRDRGAADVVGDFHLRRGALETGAVALVVQAVVDGRHADVPVVGRAALPVEAGQAVAVAVLAAAVGDCGHAGAVAHQHFALGAPCALALVAVATLVGPHRGLGQRGAHALCLCVREREAVLLRVVGVARLALEALLSPAEVGSHEAVRQVLLGQERRAVLLALRDPVGSWFGLRLSYRFSLSNCFCYLIEIVQRTDRRRKTVLSSNVKSSIMIEKHILVVLGKKALRSPSSCISNAHI